MLAAINAQIELCALELRGLGADAVAGLTTTEQIVLGYYENITKLNNKIMAGTITSLDGAEIRRRYQVVLDRMEHGLSQTRIEELAALARTRIGNGT